MPLPINLDEAASKGKDVILVAAMYKYDSYTSKFKTKLFGQSEKISPLKAATNEVAFAAKKLDIVDTPVVTYSYDYDDNKTKYIINGDNAGSDIKGAKNFAFDSEGYFYVLMDLGESVGVYSNKPGFGTHALEYGYSYDSYYISIDNVTDTLYIAMNNDVAWTMNGYPSLISSGDSEQDIYFFYTDPSDWVFHEGDPFVVNNGIVYAIGKSNGKPGLVIFDSTNVTREGNQLSIQNSENDRYVDFGWDDYGFCDPKITDMYYIDNAVYILIKDYCNMLNYSNSQNGYNGGSFVSHGVIIKYDVSTGLVSDLGWSNESLLNTEIPDGIGMYVGAQGHVFYKTDSYDNPVVLFPTDYINNPTSARTAFPSFYTPNLLNNTISNSEFYGPDRIIGIKPKKLIIADDGTAFYTDNFNAIRFKNINRVITIDLEKFAIDSENITNAETGVIFSDENEDGIFGKNAFFGGSFWGDLNIATRYLDAYDEEAGGFVLKVSTAGSEFLGIPE